VGGGVGGMVTGFVLKGVGGRVGLDVGKTVLGCAVGHPRPTELQQNSCLSSDHNTSKFAKPSSQSNGSEVDEVNPESSQHNSGIRNNRLNKQHVVIRHVKSRRGLTTSKSPPHPTYLYVVS